MVFDQLRVIFGLALGVFFGHFVAGLRATFWICFGRLFGHFVAINQAIFGFDLGVFSGIL